jgi:predicted component of type VI protein secretion system
MVRTQIQLTEEQARGLKDLAAVEGVSMACLIRRSVDTLLNGARGLSRAERKRRALAAVGMFKSGVPDLGTNHDKYLVEAYSR